MSIFFPPDDPDVDDQSPAPASRRPRRRRRARIMLALVATFALVVASVLVGGAVYLGKLDHSVNANLHRTPLLPSEQPSSRNETPRPAKGNSKAINFVLMGSDSRVAGDATQGRSDVLMILHLAGDRRSATVISFPRDMYVPIPGHGKNKINAAYAFGGPPLAVQTLEELLDTRMDHVALIDFDGFIELTDELGGVTVDNPHYSLSQGYEFPVGKITVRGAQALAYVRERHQLPRGDLDRAERQRLVVQAIWAKAMSPAILASPVAFDKFVSGVAQQVTVDDELTHDELRTTALSLWSGRAPIGSIQAPISGFATVHGQSIDVVNETKLKELGAALRADTVDQYVAKYPNG